MPVKVTVLLFGIWILLLCAGVIITQKKSLVNSERGNLEPTFNIPNFVDKTFWGGTTSGTVKAAGLPNITGTLAASWGSTARDTGAFKHEGNDPNSNMGGDSSWNNSTWASFNASRSSSIYGKSTTVQPPALQTLVIVKY